MKKFAALFSLLVCNYGVQAQARIDMPEKKFATAVAVMIDSASYSEAKEAVTAYKKMLENTQGISAYVVVYSWKKPEEVKNSLRGLYRIKQPVLEGALLVGDIPIPMIRDAQQLCSVFKMDQRINWQRSSVPSDRFYDDFHLKFNFIKRDSARAAYFYYSLDPASPQEIKMNIYTSRVKPPVVAGKSKYEVIREWFEQRVKESAAKDNRLDNLMVFTGHGYNSESQAAWAGEQLALKDQLPALFMPGGSARFMNFRMVDKMKPVLLSELQRNSLDIAIFHEHGDDVTQILNGYPDASNPQPSIENIKRYLRNKIQNAADKKQDVAEAKKRYADYLKVPLSWMDDALVDSVRLADSLFDAGLNIATEDIARIHTNARMVYFDACDNGSFHLDDYVAGRYVFSGGNTAVALANSVGVLQDLWPDEMMGLLYKGTRVGNWFKQVAYLESHLFGDPAYSFAADDKAAANRLVAFDTLPAATWQPLLQQNDADWQCLALKKLFALKRDSVSGLLKTTYFHSPYAAVRMEALKLLNKLGNADYLEVQQAAVSDPYELIRRVSGYYISARGSDSLVPALVHMAIDDRYSERVNDRARIALSFMNSAAVTAEVKKQIAASPWLQNAAEIQQQLLSSQEQTLKKTTGTATLIQNKNAKVKERLNALNELRAYNYHSVIPAVAALAVDTTEDSTLRMAALDVMAWFKQSYQAAVIVNACEQVINNEGSSAELRTKAIRTKNVIIALP